MNEKVDQVLSFGKDILISLKRIPLNRKNILRVAFFIFLLLSTSTAIEYFGFGKKLHSLEKSDQGVIFIEKSKILSRGFILDERGYFVSQSENASLILPTEGKYVHNLKVRLPEHPNNPIFINYIDLATDREITLEKRMQSSMQKNKFSFLHEFIFNIKSNSEKIELRASVPGTTVSEVVIENEYRFNPYRFFFIISAELLILVFTLSRKKIAQRPELGFLAIALICGTLLSFSEKKSYVSWDERIHYNKSNDLSFKSIVKKNIKDLYDKTNSVPASYSIEEQKQINEYLDSRLENPKNSKEKSKKIKIESIFNFYKEIAYLPSAFSLAFGRLFHLPYHIVFMLGRWANILFFSSIVFIAIKKLRSGKMIMSSIALFPTSIFIASNYNYDSWLTAFSMLGFAYLFSELQQPKKKIISKEALIIIGSFVLACAPKPVYFPILFLLFLVKPSKFKSASHYKKFLLASVLAILLIIGSLLGPLLVSGVAEGDGRGGDLVNPAGQIAFIFSEPFSYAKILFNFLGFYLSPQNADGFMTLFAYLGEIKGFLIIIAVLLLVTLMDKNGYDQHTSTLKIKLSIIAVFFLTVSLISTALYVNFTAVGNQEIIGVQQRYLIPLLFPLFFIVGSYKIKKFFTLDGSLYNVVIFAMISVVILKGIWDSVISFYH